MTHFVFFFFFFFFTTFMKGFFGIPIPVTTPHHCSGSSRYWWLILFTIFPRPRLIFPLTSDSFTSITSCSDSRTTLSSAALRISSKFLDFGLAPKAVILFSVRPCWLAWLMPICPESFPVKNVFLMSSSRALSLSELYAVTGRVPLGLISAGRIC